MKCRGSSIGLLYRRNFLGFLTLTAQNLNSRISP